jgi:alkylresorcinol/alkylpyrone synthase
MTQVSLPVARLAALATALPPHVLDQADVMRAGRGLFGAAFGDVERLVAVYANAGIERRHSCVP